MTAAEPANTREASAPVLSIVVPARNESRLIARSLVRLKEVLRRSGISWEIIVSDSGSTDPTAGIVEGRARSDLRLVRNALPGKGRALSSGMAVARGSIIGFIDADLEIDPDYILPMLDAVQQGADFAIGVNRSSRRPASVRSSSSRAVAWTSSRREQ